MRSLIRDAGDHGCLIRSESAGWTRPALFRRKRYARPRRRWNPTRLATPRDEATRAWRWTRERRVGSKSAGVNESSGRSGKKMLPISLLLSDLWYCVAFSAQSQRENVNVA